MYDKNVLCIPVKTYIIQKKQREDAKKGLEKQEKMAEISVTSHPNVDEGVTVRIKTPETDRSNTDAVSILCVVLSKTEDDFYKLGTNTTGI